jgi:hypothetical protein
MRSIRESGDLGIATREFPAYKLRPLKLVKACRSERTVKLLTEKHESSRLRKVLRVVKVDLGMSTRNSNKGELVRECARPDDND